MDSDGQQSSERLTIDGLIRLELQGKTMAAGRYDAILLRIRTGYVVAVYGTLLLFAGKENALSVVAGNPALALASLVTVLALTIILAIIDMSFRIRQLRVVMAFNRLIDIALELAMGKEVEGSGLFPLLHIAGESSLPIGARRYLTTIALIALLYLSMPALGFLVYALSHAATG